MMIVNPKTGTLPVFSIYTVSAVFAGRINADITLLLLYRERRYPIFREKLPMKFKKFGGTEQKVYDLIKPITDELGYYLWDVCYEKEGAMWYLRVFIDQDEGITIADCERANAPISDILDEKDPIAQSYMLEVGSAGLERELVKEEHFEVCRGDKVKIRFIRAAEGEKEIVAQLVGADREGVTVALDSGEERKFPLADIAFVKLYLDF